MAAEAERHIESVSAALRLLACFDSDVGLRLLDLYERTRLNRSRILRLAGTLVANGFLEHDGRTSTYRLGPALFAAGSLVAGRFSDLAEAVRPVLRALVADTGDTAMFSIVSGHTRLVLSKEEPEDALRYTVQEGQNRPISGGASGRVILAFCDEALRSQVLQSGELVTASDAPARQGAALNERLAHIREAGFDWSVGELTPHAFAIAVPVLSRRDELLGVLTLAGLEAKLTPALRERYVQLLKEQSARIPSAALTSAGASQALENA